MAETVAFKYRAFISYSHQDSSWAKWLHRALEGFRIDPDLVGRPTGFGPIPETLRPIFRDRDEFTAGPSLSEQTRAALQSSAALIVLCSPAANQSHYVNEEIRQFKSVHPGRPVVPLIVDGTPGDGTTEPLPKALRFELNADGAITDTPAEVLAADAREHADGKNLALAKVVAGLLGVSSDEIFRRAERERRRKLRIRNGLVAGFFVLALSGSFFAWQAYERQQMLGEVEALVAKYSVQDEAEPGPAATQGLTDAITAIAQGAARDPRYAKALAFLKEGKPGEAEPLLVAVAEDKKKLAARQNRSAAEAYRNLASIAELASPWKARRYYAEAVALDPDNIEGVLLHGWAQRKAGAFDEAERAFRRVLSAKETEDRNALFWARIGLGDVQQATGDPDGAMGTYRNAETLVESQEKHDRDWQYARALADSRIGNVLLAQGDLAGALKAYRNSQRIALDFAARDTDKDTWQRDLSVTYGKIGYILVLQGDLSAALDAYREGHAIDLRLVEADPNNVSRQRDLSTSYDKIGNVLLAQGDLAEASKAYDDSLEIIKSLAASDPSNAAWQDHLSTSYGKVGDIRRAKGDLAGALKAYEESLAIALKLVQSDKDNTDWQRSLAVSHNQVGDLHRLMGDWSAAGEAYESGLRIMKPLAEQQPGNLDWQRDLSVCHNNVGDTFRAQDELAAAREAYERSLTISEFLAKEDPTNARWQRDLSFSYIKIGDVLVAEGNLAAAANRFEKAAAVRRKLVELDPENAGWRADLGLSLERLGDVLVGQGRLNEAEKILRESFSIRKSLAQQGSDNMKWQRAVAVGHSQLAGLLESQARFSEAITELKQGRAIIARLMRKSPGNAQLRNDLAILDGAIEKVEKRIKAHEEAPKPVAAEHEKERQP